MRIAVTDDEAAVRTQLRGLLEQYAVEHSSVLEIQEFESGEALLQADVSDFSIIFLDIEMPGRNGLQTAQVLRERDRQVLLFFVTGFAQYAVDGYDAEATGFIVKPVSATAFRRQMDKAFRLLERRREHFLVLSNSREIRRIPISGITYIESVGHYVVIHSKEAAISFLKTLKSVEDQLTDEAFFRINQGILVHLPYVEAVLQDTAIVAGVQLNVSRIRKKGLMEALSRYLNQ